MSVVSVTAVFADADEATRIGEAMVDARLAACINILGPVHSIYRWKGEIERADEVIAVFKTSDGAADALITRIAGLHSYDVPCIFSEPIDKLLGSYADWVEANVKP
jgi:periplasmic divalent cation tolerance protein